MANAIMPTPTAIRMPAIALAETVLEEAVFAVRESLLSTSLLVSKRSEYRDHWRNRVESRGDGHKKSDERQKKNGPNLYQFPDVGHTGDLVDAEVAGN